VEPFAHRDEAGEDGGRSGTVSAEKEPVLPIMNRLSIMRGGGALVAELRRDDSALSMWVAAACQMV
jgi:hypothetical protein